MQLVESHSPLYTEALCVSLGHKKSMDFLGSDMEMADRSVGLLSTNTCISTDPLFFLRSQSMFETFNEKYSALVSTRDDLQYLAATSNDAPDTMCDATHRGPLRFPQVADGSFCSWGFELRRTSKQL
jgi:hypothetical protein